MTPSAPGTGNAGSRPASFIQNSRYSAARSLPRRPGARPSNHGFESVITCWYQRVATGPRSSKTFFRSMSLASTC
ncbi:MAG: hypothetical protein EBU31_13785, partial [Proteobacteria bacterium]|nr:hypothetical protein [Pseudomonadota bacterium]